MKNRLIIFSIVFLSFSCSSIQYFSDHLDPESPPLKGSYLVDGECDIEESKLHEIRVSNAIHKFMRENGFRESAEPDILIQSFVKETTKALITKECNYYGRSDYGGQCALKISTYEVGSIVINIVDAESKTIVWHGAIQSPAFDDLSKPNEMINKYVKKLLKNYYTDK